MSSIDRINDPNWHHRVCCAAGDYAIAKQRPADYRASEVEWFKNKLFDELDQFHHSPRSRVLSPVILKEVAPIFNGQARVDLSHRWPLEKLICFAASDFYQATYCESFAKCWGGLTGFEQRLFTLLEEWQLFLVIYPEAWAHAR